MGTTLRGVLVPLLGLALLGGDADPTGFWKGAARTPHGEILLEVRVEGGPVTWRAAASAGAPLSGAGTPVDHMDVRGDTVALEFTLLTNVGTAVMALDGVVSGDVMSGTFETRSDDGVVMGTGDWRLARSDPGRPDGL